MAHMSRKARRGHLVSSKAYSQWTDIMNKVTSERGLPQVIRELGLEWEETLDFIKAHAPGADTYGLERISEFADALARKMQSEHFEKKSTAWREFVSKQLKNGAAAAHRSSSGIRCRYDRAGAKQDCIAAGCPGPRRGRMEGDLGAARRRTICTLATAPARRSPSSPDLRAGRRRSRPDFQGRYQHRV